MHVEIDNALALLAWAQANPDGCVYYDWLVSSVSDTGRPAMDHPMCAYGFAVNHTGIVWPVECYPGVSHAEEALFDVVGGMCSECQMLLFPEPGDELP